jgi:hypothetical protein
MGDSFKAAEVNLGGIGTSHGRLESNIFIHYMFDLSPPSLHFSSQY